MRLLNNPLDILGFSASFLCALHCMALPLIAVLGMSGALPWLESEALELSLIISTLIIAGWSLVSTQRRHGNWRPLGYATLGFVVIIGSHLLHLPLAHILAGLGGLAIAYAHYLNWRLLRHASTSGARSLRLPTTPERKVA